MWLISISECDNNNRGASWLHWRSEKNAESQQNTCNYHCFITVFENSQSCDRVYLYVKPICRKIFIKPQMMCPFKFDFFFEKKAIAIVACFAINVQFPSLLSNFWMDCGLQTWTQLFVQDLEEDQIKLDIDSRSFKIK